MPSAIHVSTCSPNLLRQEWNVTSLHDEILVEPFVVEDGCITPPSGPGLGVELAGDVVPRLRG